jgi:hypothetical protein
MRVEFKLVCGMVGVVEIHFVLFIASLIAFYLYMNYKIDNIDLGAEDREEFEQILGYIATQLEEIVKIKDYMPEFTINQNPFQPIIDRVIENWMGPNDIRTDQARGDDGRYLNAKEETEKTD